MGNNLATDGPLIPSQIKLGISACLLGQKVRYDGGDRLDPWLTQTLGPHLVWVPVCPEAECGLGVPREPMRLTGDPQAPRLLTVRTRQDLTARLLEFSQLRATDLADADLWGFIFKSRSPSCGAAGVKVYREGGKPQPRGVGLFAGTFMAHFPTVPVTEENRLYDPAVRENFIQQVFVWQRWRKLRAQEDSPARLLEFHTRHKLALLAHSPRHYRLMGRLAARAEPVPLSERYSQYETLLRQALQLHATPPKNANVLQHILGYFKKVLAPAEKLELLTLIEQHRRGEIPLLAPLTLLQHHMRRHRPAYLMEQYYLTPHPLELLLRFHA